MTEKKKLGRPPKWDNREIHKRLFDLMCGFDEDSPLDDEGEPMVCGMKTATDILGMPNRTPYDWFKKEGHPFITIYAYARATQADIEFDQLRKLENNVYDKCASHKRPGSMAQVFKVIIDSRKWRLGRLSKRYSSKKGVPEHEVRRIQTQLTHRILEQLSRKLNAITREVNANEDIEPEARQQVIDILSGLDPREMLRDAIMGAMDEESALWVYDSEK